MGPNTHDERHAERRITTQTSGTAPARSLPYSCGQHRSKEAPSFHTLYACMYVSYYFVLRLRRATACNLLVQTTLPLARYIGTAVLTSLLSPSLVLRVVITTDPRSVAFLQQRAKSKAHNTYSLWGARAGAVLVLCWWRRRDRRTVYKLQDQKGGMGVPCIEGVVIGRNRGAGLRSDLEYSVDT